MRQHSGSPGPGRPGGDDSWLRRLSGGLAGAAVLIGAVTVVARAVGFGRWLVFSHTVGQTCLGSVYLTANMVPTLVFEAVAGGALVTIVVPLLSGPTARGDTYETRRIASALLTWTLVGLLPLLAAGVVVAGPVIGLLLGDFSECSQRLAVDIGTRMLLIFLPQLLLYAVMVVLGGVLQAHRRFLGPALAPLFSSLVVIAAYALFYVAAGESRRGGLDDVGLVPQLVLAVGTTLGVAALALTVVIPTARLRLGLRPTLSFPPGVAARARSLGGAGMATLAAHQVVIVAVARLANDQGAEGALTLYTYAWQLFLLPYAALAVPIALSAFPTLSSRIATGDLPGYATTAARTTRGVLLICCAAAAVLAAVAGPAARVFVLGAPGGDDASALARAMVAFAPGLVGYGLVAHIGRALYAAGRDRASAGAVVAGWGTVLAADIGLALTVPKGWVVTAFGIGNTIGMTLAGALLLTALVTTCGRQAAEGTPRALVGGVTGGAAGYVAGAAIVTAIGPAGLWGSAGLCLLGAVTAMLVFAAVSFVVDAPDTRAVVRRWFPW